MVKVSTEFAFESLCAEAGLVKVSAKSKRGQLIPSMLCSSKAVQGKSVNKKKRRGGKEGEMGKGALLVAMTQSA